MLGLHVVHQILHLWNIEYILELYICCSDCSTVHFLFLNKKWWSISELPLAGGAISQLVEPIHVNYRCWLVWHSGTVPEYPSQFIIFISMSSWSSSFLCLLIRSFVHQSTFWFSWYKYTHIVYLYQPLSFLYFIPIVPHLQFSIQKELSYNFYPFYAPIPLVYVPELIAYIQWGKGSDKCLCKESKDKKKEGNKYVFHSTMSSISVFIFKT